MSNDKYIIVISSNNSSDLESTYGISSSDISSEDIVSSKGQSKELLKWYDNTTDEDIPVFKFSKSTGSKVKASKSSVSKAKASKFKEVPTPKNPPQTYTVKSLVPINKCIIELANVKTWDSILKRTFGVRKPPTAGNGTYREKGKRKLGGGS